MCSSILRIQNLGSKSTPTYLKLSFHAKKILAVHIAFDTFAHILWDSTKHVPVLTDNKNFTRFLQAKFPISFWSCVDLVFNFIFVLGHIPGKANAAAHYLSRVHITPYTKVKMRFNSKWPVQEVSLIMGMQVPDNSLNHLHFASEIYMTNQDLKSRLPPSELNVFHATNLLDTFYLSDKNNPIDLRLEQQKTSDICIV